MNTEKSNEKNSALPDSMTKVPEGFKGFDDVVSKQEFLSNMHKVPEGFHSFIDVSSSSQGDTAEAENEAQTDTEVADEKKNKLFRHIITGVFCGFLCLVLASTVIIKDSEFSESENRMLAQKPSLTLNTLADGSFMKDFESYLTDQFPLRDFAITLKTFSDRMLGIKRENGVYIGKDGFLFDKPTAFDKKSTKNKVIAMSDFASEYPDIKKAVLISPNSSFVYSDKLPENLVLDDQSEILGKIKKVITEKSLKMVDTASAMQKARKKDDSVLLFYKTDHHWSTRGAYVAFRELERLWELKDKSIKHSFYTVSETFEGTLGSKSGVHSTKDKIEICIPGKSLGTYIVNYESQQKKKATLFENERLEQKNQYEIFLGGNYDKVSISTTAKTSNSLLVIKDSYANCMIPMLTAHFSKIVVLDPRYLTDSMDDIMKENDFTHMLFLYNLNTFLEDTSIVDALSD